MHVRLRELAARQHDLVAAWQLLDAGWTERMVAHHRVLHGWRPVHVGVYALSHAPLTQRQLWMAATLTAPRSFLSHASAGAAYGIRPVIARFETITRPGNAGRRTCGRLVVSHSRTLPGDTTTHNGIPITTGARTVIDLAAHLDDRATARMLRETLRLKVATPGQLHRSLHEHQGRRGTRLLKTLNDRYSGIPYARARSDAECFALEVLYDAGGEMPELNVRIAGHEADLVWRNPKLIVEIDGPQYHQIADEDARKQRAWEFAGYTVRRIYTDDLYATPKRLIALVHGA